MAKERGQEAPDALSAYLATTGKLLICQELLVEARPETALIEERVRMVFEHQGEHESQWAAIASIASKSWMHG